MDDNPANPFRNIEAVTHSPQLMKIMSVVDATWRGQSLRGSSLNRLRRQYELCVQGLEKSVPKFPEVDVDVFLPSDGGSTADSELSEQREALVAVAKRLDVAAATLSRRTSALRTEKAAAIAHQKSWWVKKMWDAALGRKYRDVVTITSDLDALATNEALQVVSARSELVRVTEAVASVESEATLRRAARQEINNWNRDVRQWARSHVAEFLTEESLLSDIAGRRTKLRNSVRESGLLSAGENVLAEAAGKIIQFVDAYAIPGQLAADALFDLPQTHTAQFSEWISVWRDLETAMGIELLNEAPLSSFDDHFDGRSAADWKVRLMSSPEDGMDDPPMPELRTWLEARQLRMTEFDDGIKAVPYSSGETGGGTGFVDRAWLVASLVPTQTEYFLSPLLMQARQQALEVAQRGPVNSSSRTGEGTDFVAAQTVPTLGLSRLM